MTNFHIINSYYFNCIACLLTIFLLFSSIHIQATITHERAQYLFIRYKKNDRRWHFPDEYLTNQEWIETLQKLPKKNENSPDSHFIDQYKNSKDILALRAFLPDRMRLSGQVNFDALKRVDMNLFIFNIIIERIDF